MHTGRPTPGHSSRQPIEFSYSVSRFMEYFLGALVVDILRSNCHRCPTVPVQLFRRCLWRVVLIERIGWRYFVRGSPECQTYSYIRHHHRLPECVPRQAMANPNIQVVRHCADALWVYLVHVWLACPREGHPPRPCPAEVGIATYSSFILRR